MTDSRYITLKAKKVTVLIYSGPDEIHVLLDMPTPFPALGYDGSAVIKVSTGYGIQWCNDNLGAPDEVVDVRAIQKR
jgi:hypothetical protein